MSRIFKSTLLLLLTFFITLGNSKVAFSDEIDFINRSVAEIEKVNFQNITTDQGLSGSLITCIFQDSKGYMWIGTEDGLNQYDGKTITIYNYESGNENSLSSTYVTSIEEDSEGNIWVGTYGGLNIINSKTEKITRINSTEYYDNSLSNEYITKLYKDSNNTM